jgi:hypothetical protein
MAQPIQLIASAGYRAGALFKNQSASVAEIGLVLPQAVLDPGGVRKVAGAESEGVGRTPGPLLGVPRFSCAKALVAQRKAAAAAMERQFDFEIILDHSFDGLPLLEVIPNGRPAKEVWTLPRSKN